jgi:hypothetical protein
MSLFRFISKPPVDVYPLLGAVTVACGYGAFLTYRNLFQTQDVIIDKTDKESWQKQGNASLPLYSFFLKENRLITKSPEMRKLDIKGY